MDWNDRSMRPERCVEEDINKPRERETTSKHKHFGELMCLARWYLFNDQERMQISNRCKWIFFLANCGLLISESSSRTIRQRRYIESLNISFIFSSWITFYKNPIVSDLQSTLHTTRTDVFNDVYITYCFYLRWFRGGFKVSKFLRCVAPARNLKDRRFF